MLWAALNNHMTVLTNNSPLLPRHQVFVAWVLRQTCIVWTISGLSLQLCNVEPSVYTKSLTTKKKNCHLKLYHLSIYLITHMTLPFNPINVMLICGLYFLSSSSLHIVAITALSQLHIGHIVHCLSPEVKVGGGGRGGAMGQEVADETKRNPCLRRGDWSGVKTVG